MTSRTDRDLTHQVQRGTESLVFHEHPSLLPISPVCDDAGSALCAGETAHSTLRAAVLGVSNGQHCSQVMVRDTPASGLPGNSHQNVTAEKPH